MIRRRARRPRRMAQSLQGGRHHGTSHPQKSSKWLRTTAAAGRIPWLLAQVSIVLLCVPQTLAAGSVKRHTVVWEALPVLLNGEEKVTIRVSDGAIRGDVVSVQDNGIHLQRITLATDRQRYPAGSDALIPRDAVQEIRFDTLRGSRRMVGGLIGGIGGLVAGPWIAVTIAKPRDGIGVAGLAGLVLGPLGFGGLGYHVGKQADRETTILTIAD